MASAYETLTRSWQGVGVDAMTVEHALADLLRQLYRAADHQPPHPVPRTRVLTLVVLSDDPTALGPVVAEISQLAVCHPMRALLVTATPDAPKPGLAVAATTHCVLASGVVASVCFEEVRLTLPLAMAAHLSSVVTPLLIPDLPVVVWRIGNLPRIDDEILSLADHLIVDSDSVQPRGLTQLAQLLPRLDERVSVSDLAWEKVTPCRDLLAQLFDPPEARAYQRGVTSVQITYTSGALGQPLLMLGWLASRLGWTPEPSERLTGRGCERICFQGVGGPVEASLAAVPPTGGTVPGEVHRVALTARHGGDVVTFAIDRQPDGACRASRSGLPGHPEATHLVALARPSLAAVLSQVLGQPDEAAVYRDSLELAARLEP